MKIIATGSIAYDYLMRFPGKFSDHLLPEHLQNVSLSFLVDDMTKHWGGVAANIAYSMALFGLKPMLMGTVGRDFPDYRQWLESHGVDCSTVKQIDEVFTASFFCNTDTDNNQIASFYAGAMGLADTYTLADAYDGQPDLVIVSPNHPGAMNDLAEECRQRGIRFIYDPSQQVPRLSGDELAQSLKGAYALIVNQYESEVISDKTGLSIDEIGQQVQVLVITRGKDGSTIYDRRSGELVTTQVDAFPTEQILDPTGGGDAFRAGFIYGLIHGWSLDVAAQMGSLTATYCIEKNGTQTHYFTPEEFVSRYRSQYDDQGILDALLATTTI